MGYTSNGSMTVTYTYDPAITNKIVTSSTDPSPTTSSKLIFHCRCCNQWVERVCIRGACLSCHKDNLCHGETPTSTMPPYVPYTYPPTTFIPPFNPNAGDVYIYD